MGNNQQNNIYKFKLSQIKLSSSAFSVNSVDILTGIQHTHSYLPTSENADPHLVDNIRLDLLVCCFFLKQCFLAAQASNFYSLPSFNERPQWVWSASFSVFVLLCLSLRRPKIHSQKNPKQSWTDLLKLEQKTWARPGSWLSFRTCLWRDWIRTRGTCSG